MKLQNYDSWLRCCFWSRPIESKNANKNQDQVLIETSNFENGTYICSMMVNGKIVDSEKLVIIQ